MSFHLVVTEAFGVRVRGEHITDPAEIAEIEASEDAGHVVRVEDPAAPAQE